MDDRIMSLLEGLSEKMGTTADHLYKVLVKQAKIDAITSVIIFAFFLLCAPLVLAAWHHLIPLCVPENPKGQYSFEREWPSEIQASFAGLCVVTILLAIGFLIQFFTSIETVSKGIFNPEASAVEKILGYINKH